MSLYEQFHILETFLFQNPGVETTLQRIAQPLKFKRLEIVQRERNLLAIVWSYDKIKYSQIKRLITLLFTQRIWYLEYFTHYLTYKHRRPPVEEESSPRRQTQLPPLLHCFYFSPVKALATRQLGISAYFCNTQHFVFFTFWHLGCRSALYVFSKTY